MAKKQQEIIICYDANTTTKTLTEHCPICFSQKEIFYKDVQPLKAILVECCSSNKYSKFKENREKSL